MASPVCSRFLGPDRKPRRTRHKRKKASRQRLQEITMNPLPRLFGRTRRYTDIDISIEEHIQERADELEEEGMQRRQAEQTARREFGNVALLQQRSREQWQWSALESFLGDLKFTLR